ncbi:hypothetical protein DPMN_072868 [Dreissena polymorpha]|uniref:Uncharacterized protein n=1 Tax=Dreissena polymorpha TaxID=45954 RepID=A0A9D4BY42_DREPO|nr:hypothetical protein DPMN_072868 [Dreissena polymorpha]
MVIGFRHTTIGQLDGLHPPEIPESPPDKSNDPPLWYPFPTSSLDDDDDDDDEEDDDDEAAAADDDDDDDDDEGDDDTDISNESPPLYTPPTSTLPLPKFPLPGSTREWPPIPPIKCLTPVS